MSATPRLLYDISFTSQYVEGWAITTPWLVFTKTNQRINTAGQLATRAAMGTLVHYVKRKFKTRNFLVLYLGKIYSRRLDLPQPE